MAVGNTEGFKAAENQQLERKEEEQKTMVRNIWSDINKKEVDNDIGNINVT